MLLLELERPGTFVALRPDRASQERVYAWMDGLDNPNRDLHCTVLVERKKALPVSGGEVEITVRDWEIELWGKVLVACFRHPVLEKFHKRILHRYDVVAKYPEYRPHMTLSYDHLGDIPTKPLPEVTFRSLTVGSYW